MDGCSKNKYLFVYSFLLLCTTGDADPEYNYGPYGNPCEYNGWHNSISCRTNDNFILSTTSIRDVFLEVQWGTTDNIDFHGFCLFETEEDTPLTTKTTIFQNENLKLRNVFSDHVGIELVNFSEKQNVTKQINAFVEKQTHQKIKHFITEKEINNDTKLIFENGVYLNAEWLKPFNESYTDYRDFYADGEKKIKMKSMVQVNKFHVRTMRNEYVGVSGTVIELPFKNPSMRMLIFLPGNDSLKDIEIRLNSLSLPQYWHDRKKNVYTEYTEYGDGDDYIDEVDDNGPEPEPEEVYLQLPVFKMENLRIKFNDYIEESNSDDLLTRNDIYNMAPNEQIVLRNVYHGSDVSFMENGITAAGVTELIFESFDSKLNSTNGKDQPHFNGQKTEREKPKLPLPFENYNGTKFIVDRPFVFAIIDNTSILFTGTIRNDNFNPKLEIVETYDECVGFTFK